MSNSTQVMAAAGGSAIFLLAVPCPAHAAVRHCYPSISSEIVAAVTEIEAKRIALGQWREKAAKYGAGFQAWHLAVNRAIQCFPKDGKFECVAFGQPCIIEQNPSRNAPAPEPKGQPL